MAQEVRVFAPATVANVACGFDVLGFALHEPGDEVILRKNGSGKVTISEITGDDGKLPRNPLKNTAGVVIVDFLKHIGKETQGIDMVLHKKMPLGSGLGSSAASAAAALVAINELMDKPLSRLELLPFAMEGERLACGAAHADNVAPALMGGFVLIRSYSPLDVLSIQPPKKLMATVLHPQIEIKTKDSRNILRTSILLKDAVTQWGNVGGLVAGLLTQDYGLIQRSLEDVIIEPIRSLLIPYFDDIKISALDAGALGCSISGSGPSIFALSDSENTAQKVAHAMTGVLERTSIGYDIYVSPVNAEGPVVLSIK